MKRNYLLLFSAALTILGINATKAQFYNLGSQVIPSDVNNAKTVTGTTGNVTSWYWTPANGIANMGTVVSGTIAGRILVAENGLISGSMTNPSTNLMETGTYDINTGTWTYLGGLVGSSDFTKSSSWGISNDGTTIVGLGWINAGTGHATLWANGTVTDLGSTVTGRSSRANDISADKATVIGWQDSNSGYRQGAYWKNGTQTLLTDASGGEVGEAGAISGNGVVIIGGSLINPYVKNIITGNYQEITHPNAGTFYRGGATGISYDGTTVVGYFRGWPGGPYFGEGYIWTAATGRVNLDTYVSNLGINTQGISLSTPLAISPDGKKITGVGKDSSNQLFGFLIDLTNYLSTNEIATTSDIKLYPNPVKDELFIKGLDGVSEIEMTNTVGQMVVKETIKTGSINLNHLKSGVYFVKIKNKTQSLVYKITKA